MLAEEFCYLQRIGAVSFLSERQIFQPLQEKESVERAGGSADITQPLYPGFEDEELHCPFRQNP
jgi:hypothetical protein